MPTKVRTFHQPVPSSENVLSIYENIQDAANLVRSISQIAEREVTRKSSEKKIAIEPLKVVDDSVLMKRKQQQYLEKQLTGRNCQQQHATTANTINMVAARNSINTKVTVNSSRQSPRLEHDNKIPAHPILYLEDEAAVAALHASHIEFFNFKNEKNDDFFCGKPSSWGAPSCCQNLSKATDIEMSSL
mmetsp:Transcript_33418/g.40473  ORF Transcript_33418/g.40473 Transcript_33418/m.40473 type:complete len:188 (+) Transcript_33418:329-892(+)